MRPEKRKEILVRVIPSHTDTGKALPYLKVFSFFNCFSR